MQLSGKVIVRTGVSSHMEGKSNFLHSNKRLNPTQAAD